MRNFFTEPENITADKIVLTEDTSHIKNVLRLGEGCEILVFDGTGMEYKARIIGFDSGEVICEKLEESFCAAEPKIKVTLYQGIPKSDKMEHIIQKAAELGVYEVVPVKMDRCVAKADKADKIKRWNKISREAAKQSGRGIVPKVSEPIRFKEAVLKMAGADLAFMPYEVMGHEGKRGLKELLKKADKPKNIGVIVGPEGGVSDSEAEFSKENGIFSVGLGKRILRTETVGMAMLSVIMYEYDEI